MKKFGYAYYIWALLFIVFPLILVLFYSINANGAEGLSEFSFTLENYKRFFEPIYLKILLVSIGISVLSTLLCFLVGYPIAYFISQMDESKRNILILLFVVPMWMNFLLRTYAWFTLLGNNGLLNKFLGVFGVHLDLMYNLKAVLLGMVYNFLPFMVLPIYSVLLKMDNSLIEAAKDLGANKRQVFTKVIFPLSLPGVYTGLTMVFIPAISTFVIPSLLGGNKFYLIGNLIEQQFTFTGDWGYGSAISLILILIMLFVLLLSRATNKDSGKSGGGLW
ncbi:ABC transporter permease [Peptoniphilus sp. GNH]|nr:putative spermidine/putrescine ABC transporter, permease protein PotB [Clostridiales bacterium KA00134]UHR03076.1 ABC transporter permease [Peptoniphilus sp. GNH]